MTLSISASLLYRLRENRMEPCMAVKGVLHLAHVLRMKEKLLYLLCIFPHDFIVAEIRRESMNSRYSFGSPGMAWRYL